MADIHFYRVKDGQTADIPVAFVPQQHGDKSKQHPDFSWEVLGHGKWPKDSYVHFNNVHNWTLSPAEYGT